MEEDLPRVGSAMYNLIHEDEEIRNKTLRKWKRLNKYLFLPLYRLRILPLIGFGRTFLVLTTIGRKTGKKYKTPLEYHRIDGIITIFSGRGKDSDWWKNMRVNPDAVWIRHGFHYFHARVEFMTDEDQKLKIIKWYVVKHKNTAKLLFGWNPITDDPETADFSKILKIIEIVRLYRKYE